MKDILKLAVEIRSFEQNLLEMYKNGELSGTVHTCLGQELTSCTITAELQEHDFVTSNHRGHGHYLARTRDFKGLLAEIMGRPEGVCQGLGGTQHLATKNFLANGIQAGLTPIAVGIAWAQKLRQEKAITVSFIGDGTLGEGVLYESLNIASLREVPVLFVVENNQIAQSTPISENLSGNIAARFSAFDISVFSTTSHDLTDLESSTKKAVGHVREMRRPAVLIVDCHRLAAHSKGDDTRPQEELQNLWNQDYLHKAMGESKDLQNAVQEIKAKMKTWADGFSFHKIDTNKTPPPKAQWSPVAHKSPDSFWGRTYSEALAELASENEKMYFIGEDVAGEYGGAFKISKLLAQKHPEKLSNMPISEAAIVGVATGLAIKGFRPFAEIMFGDFVTLAADQIVNHAAKFSLLYPKLFSLNMVVRTPMGGYRGYGATHSQTLEKMFLGTPGLSILAPSLLTPPRDLASCLLTEDIGPTLLVENKSLYSESTSSLDLTPYEIFQSSHRFPMYNLRPRSSQFNATLICYGGMLSKTLAAADILFRSHDWLAQIIVLTEIDPLPVEDILTRLEDSQPVLFIEEGTPVGSLSGEIAYALIKNKRNIPFERHASQETFIPAAPTLEKEILPSSQSIVNLFLQTFGNL